MEVGRKVIFELIGRFLHTHVGIRGGQLNNFGVSKNQLCFVVCKHRSLGNVLQANGFTYLCKIDFLAHFLIKFLQT